jgi:hypothetical protein
LVLEIQYQDQKKVQQDQKITMAIKGSKTVKFHNNKIMYVGFDIGTLHNNLYLKPKGSCNDQARHEDK